MAEQAIYQRLRDSVSDLGGRIYPLVLPQDVAYPAAVYQRIGPTERVRGFGSTTNLREGTFQVDVYSRRDKGFSAFLTVAKAVGDALERFSNLTLTPALDVAYVENERDLYEDETELFRKSYDVRTWYREA